MESLVFASQPRFIAEKHPPGLVSIFTGELTRYKDFLVSYRRLLVPTGSGELVQTGPYINENREQAMTVFESNPQCHWQWMMDDDHKFPQDLLLQQLDHFYAEKFDVLGVMYLKRQAPFPPVGQLYRVPAFGTPCEHSNHFSTEKFDVDCPACASYIKLKAIEWSDVPRFAKFWIDDKVCLGGAALLMNRKVLDVLSKPYFQIGRIAPHLVLEDTFFSIRCRERGLKIGMDLSLALLGHTGRITYWPSRDPRTGEWGVGFDSEAMSPLGPQPSPERLISTP